VTPGHDDSEDARLVRAALGSDAAYGRLVRRHEGAVRAFARRLLADPGEAEDVAQDAFVHAWSRLSHLKEPARFKSWVMGIVYRKAASRTRSLMRRMRRDGQWAQMRDVAIDPAGEAQATAGQLLAMLSMDQRAALALCEGAGWSHAEAARILDQPLGTVKSNIARAKARLRAITGDADEQD
jgi:RNA polymerase sigma-70 factor (ECF subfamily)